MIIYPYKNFFILINFLLCGYTPFVGNNDKQLIQSIVESKLTFPNEDWKNISDSAKDLIKKMLCSEKKRI